MSTRDGSRRWHRGQGRERGRIGSFEAALALAVVAGLLPWVGAERASARSRAACPVGAERVRLAGAEACVEEVSFRNGEVELAGRWFTPPDGDAVPVAVFIRGSGPSRRQNPWVEGFAGALLEAGFGVLIPDKRGSGRSAGDWRRADYEDRAADALAAVEYVRNRREVRPDAVGVLGLSQGGMIAPVAAAKSEAVAFVVNVVGGAIRFPETVKYEMRRTFREEGLSGSELEAALEMLGVAASYAFGELSWEGYARALEETRAVLGPRTDEFFLADRDHWRWDFFRRWADFDPADWWCRVRQPSLVLLGATDTNTPTGASAERIRRAFRETDHPDATVRVFPDLGHSLWDMSGGMQEHRLHPEVQRTLVKWLRTRFGGDP